MPFENSATYREITSQTDAWQQAIKVMRTASLPTSKKYEQVFFTGCGSTYYLSLSAAALFQELVGETARAVPGGELLLNPQTVLPLKKDDLGGKTLLVAISRSGTTTETVKAVEKYKGENRGDVIVISNYDETLSKYGDFNIIIPKGQEESVAQTRSFASMYVAAAALCARMAGRDDLLESMTALPQIGQRLMLDYESSARRIGENLDFNRFYFLGSGIRYGLACEVNLKMKEMSLTDSEPFHFLEFRHGPKSMVDEKTVVVGLLSEANLNHERAVLNEIQALGGKVVSLAESGADVSFRSQVPEQVRAVLYLPILQLMAFYRSLAKGLNPDRPNNLTAVISLDL
jgi:glutamine---fructose-6-phosphate transaminase (isomerizing)